MKTVSVYMPSMGIRAWRYEFIEGLVRSKQEAMAKEVDAWLSEHLKHTDDITLEQRMAEFLTMTGRCKCGDTKEFRYSI